MTKTIPSTMIWLLLLLVSCGSFGLPRSEQNHYTRGIVKSKSTSTSRTTSGPTTTSSSTSSTLPTTVATSATNFASVPITTSATSTITTTTSRTTTETMTTLKTKSKTKTKTKIGTSSNVTIGSSPSTVASTTLPTTKKMVPLSSTILPEKTASRTMSTTGISVEFSPSTRKSDDSKVNVEVTSTMPSTLSSTSAKETRESSAKIRPQIKITTNYTSASEGVRLPEGASAALAKPTKYHYYPHNQHIYLLPECAVQQVCNAVYVRLNFTQPLCACPGRYRDPCSASLDSDDLHTTELVTDPRTKALTLVKTCEPVAEMRECRAPRDWSLLALQNVRTGKSHYLVICRCPDTNVLEGPMSHDQPTYASVPGIRVYGMMCVQGNRRGRPLRYTRSLFTGSPFFEGKMTRTLANVPEFPWNEVTRLSKSIVWE